MKVLIIGASSFLGKKLDKYLCKKGITSVGTYFMNSIEGERYIRLNLMDYNEIKGVLDKVVPDVIIILSAISIIEECEKNKTLALTINTFSVGYIAEWCLNRNKLVIFISSENVFDGSSSPYYERSKYSPLNFYGKTKVMAEKLIRTIDCPFAIIRLPLLYGYNNKFDKDTILRSVVKSLSNRREIFLDNNGIKYPTLIDDVSKYLVEVINRNLRGIFHFSSQDALTKFEFGLEIAEIFGFEKSLIKVKHMEENIQIKKPHKVEFINTNFRKSNFIGVEGGLSIVKNQILENINDLKKAYI